MENLKPYLILLLSLLLPTSGHFILKRYKKATIFLIGLVMLLFFGLVMEGKFYTLESLHPLLLLGFLGDLGNGIFYVIIKLLGLGGGNIRSVTYHYGTTYLVTAGLLNYLIALNAFDIARGKRL